MKSVVTFSLPAEREGKSCKFHVEINSKLEGHHLAGADCFCEPKILIPHNHKQMRVFLHFNREVTNGK